MKVIEQAQITESQMKELLNECLSDRHLFYGLVKREDDSVFNRTFSLLIIEAVMEANNRSNPSFLSESEVLEVHKKLLDYSKREKALEAMLKRWDGHILAHIRRMHLTA